MRRSRRRKQAAVAVGVALTAAGLALAAAVSASARDGHGSDGGAPVSTTTRGHGSDDGAPQTTTTRGADDHPGGGHAGRPVFASSLAPSLTTDPSIHGVAPGGFPWQLLRGTVRISADGRLRVDVRGLVIPATGTPGPVATVSASLYCAPDGSAAAATTSTVAISDGGNATIDQAVSLPATCLAPVVLVNPNGNAAAYIAATGWR